MVLLPTPYVDPPPGTELMTDARLAYNGAIRQAGETAEFIFSGRADQQFFMDVLEGDSTDLIWSLVDPTGNVMYQNGVMSATIGDSGPFKLSTDGVYTIRVTSWEGTRTGAFKFQLWDVPPEAEYFIEIGDDVRGALETPGRSKVYYFHGVAGQDVMVDVKEGDNTSILWEITHETGLVIYSNGIMSALIGDSEPLRLQLDGQYKLRVHGYYGATGAYAFKLWHVPPADEFEIAIGQEVRRDEPGPGAGLLETPGVRDIYHFTAPAGTTIMFDVLVGETTYIYWTLEHVAGEVLLRNQIMSTLIGDSGPITLALGGSYKITVSGYMDTVGAYAFVLRPS